MPCFTPRDYDDMAEARSEMARLPSLFVEALSKRLHAEHEIAPEWAANKRLIEILLPELCSEVRRLVEAGLLEQTSPELQTWARKHMVRDDSRR